MNDNIDKHDKPLEGKYRALGILAVCEVAAMALWFSASAVVPSMMAEYPLTATQASLFTSMVQAGFVIGSLTSAIFSLADRIDPRRFFMASALIAAIANAAILLFEPGTAPVYAMRFITGMTMFRQFDAARIELDKLTVE